MQFLTLSGFPLPQPPFPSPTPRSSFCFPWFGSFAKCGWGKVNSIGSTLTTTIWTLLMLIMFSMFLDAIFGDPGDHPVQFPASLSAAQHSGQMGHMESSEQGSSIAAVAAVCTFPIDAITVVPELSSGKNSVVLAFPSEILNVVFSLPAISSEHNFNGAIGFQIFHAAHLAHHQTPRALLSSTPFLPPPSFVCHLSARVPTNSSLKFHLSPHSVPQHPPWNPPQSSINTHGSHLQPPIMPPSWTPTPAANPSPHTNLPNHPPINLPPPPPINPKLHPPQWTSTPHTPAWISTSQPQVHCPAVASTHGVVHFHLFSFSFDSQNLFLLRKEQSYVLSLLYS